MYGAAGLEKGGKEEGARKGGRDTEKRTGQEEEKGERTGYCWGKQRGRILKRVKRPTAKQRESRRVKGGLKQ